jgi:hypothetical protein
MRDGRARSSEAGRCAILRLDGVAIEDYTEVLTDADFVVQVEVQIPDRKRQTRLLVKMVDGDPRLVGWGKEDSE